MDIVLLTPQIIDQMLVDERFNQLPQFKDPPRLPVIVNPRPERWRKPCCGQRKPQPPPNMLPAAEPAIDYNGVKLRIYNMPAEQKVELRKRMGCDRVVMQFKNHVREILRDEF